jgi:hypothetical protein
MFQLFGAWFLSCLSWSKLKTQYSRCQVAAENTKEQWDLCYSRAAHEPKARDCQKIVHANSNQEKVGFPYLHGT